MTHEEAYSARLCFVCFKPEPQNYLPSLDILYHDRCRDVVWRCLQNPQPWDGPYVPKTAEKIRDEIVQTRASYAL